MLAPAVLLPLLLAATVPAPVPGVATLRSPEGHLALQTGLQSQPLPGKLADAVLAHALLRRTELGLPSTSTLSRPVSFGTRFGASFHMAQLVDGIEVEGAEVIVTVDKDRRVVQMSSSVAPYSQAITGFKLSSDEALEIASSSIPFAMRTQDGHPYGGTKMKMFPWADEVHAGYLIWVPTLDMRDNWYVAVDANSGEVLWQRNRVFNSDAADVYPRSPGGLDQGVGVAPVQRITVDHLLADRPGGFIAGDQLDVWNCCPNENCSVAPGAGPKRSTGMSSFGGQNFNYDLPMCDRRNLATNDPSVHASGDYVYTPVDPPSAAYAGHYANQLEPSDSDAFAEVNAYYNVNRVYDFVRGLSAAAQPLFPGEDVQPFQLRDARLGKKSAVWTNVTTPDLQDAYQNFPTAGMARTDKLVRTDNAAFTPKESFTSFTMPGITLDVDTLVIYQGSVADFGYDASVLWHEFGHGVIYSTAAFESFTIDSRSGNNEGGALHEGIADFISGIMGNKSTIGEYVGPREPGSGSTAHGSLRDMDNDYACPDVLEGEVHQDSQHFSGALWKARQTLSEGIDNGETFDAAFYAALASMTPATDFETAAAIVSNHEVMAFTQVPDAKAKLDAIFAQKGVVGCSKVVDMTGVTAPRPYFGIGGTQQAGIRSGQVVPGPYQIHMELPQGASNVSISGQWQSANFGSTSQPQIYLMTRWGSPVTFSRSGGTLSNDADVDAKGTLQGEQVYASTDIQIPCGGDVYIAVGSASAGGEVLGNLRVTVAKSPDCPTGPGNGNSGGQSVTAISGGGTDVGGPAAKTGCGCTSVDPMAGAFGLMVLAGLARRRRIGS